MIKIRLNYDVYSLKSIRAAKEAYSDLANIAIIRRRRDIELIFTSCRFDEEQTVKEFENYLIGLENSQ